MSTTRILFLAENVTLAQVVRLAVLARSLPHDRYEVHFACSAFDEMIFGGLAFRKWKLGSVSRAFVDHALEKGKRIYERETLESYVDEELRLYDDVKPDVVVADLRFSAAISTAVARVPYVNLVNAYWSPFCVDREIPLPEHPIVRLLGIEMAERYFPMAVPKVFAHFARPVNVVRKKHGLAEIGSLREVLTFGNATVFPDTPSLVPMRSLPPSQEFLGPVLWAPSLPLPDRWDQLGRDRPCVYVTMGSSGRADLVPTILEGLAKLDVDVTLSTAGGPVPAALSPRVLAARYLPGDLAARKAAVVVSNGGSSTGYQALAEGTPVVGIAFNLDQYLASTAIRGVGAGLLLRSGTLTATGLAEAVTRVLREPGFCRAAEKVAEEMRAMCAADRFQGIIDALATQRDATSSAASGGGDRTAFST